MLNVVVIGASLIAFERFGLFGTSFGMHALDYLLFASLIAAVDPVAVFVLDFRICARFSTHCL